MDICVLKTTDFV